MIAREPATVNDELTVEWLKDRASNVFSQFGEDGVLEAIFEVIGIENRWCFECGAADGILFSNTRLLLEQGWNALLVEGDPETFKRLEATTAHYGPQVRRVNRMLGHEHKLETVLEEHGVPRSLDLMVIDVDGQDYYLVNQLLHYRPRVLVIEYDWNLDKNFTPALGGEAQAGLQSTLNMIWGRYYKHVYVCGVNIVAVKYPLYALIENHGGILNAAE